MKTKEYFAEVLKMSDQQVSDALRVFLKQRSAFRFSGKDPESRPLPHNVRFVRRNIARLKMVMAQRQKEK